MYYKDVKTFLNLKISSSQRHERQTVRVRIRARSKMANMYDNKFVACILVDGKPQPELRNGVTEIPFGTEYTIRFRNKNSRRAVVKFTLDGEDAGGSGYVIPANSFIDIERFADTPKKFKVAALDSADAVDYGKNGEQDGTKGIIESRFYLEKEYTQIVEQHHHHYYHECEPWYTNPWKKYTYDGCFGASSSTGMKSDNLSAQNFSSDSSLPFGSGKSRSRGMHFAAPNASMPAPGSVRQSQDLCLGVEDSVSISADYSQDVVTVEGEYSNQKFGITYIDVEDNYTTIRIQLKGVMPGEKVQLHKPVKKANDSEMEWRKEYKFNELELTIKKMQKEIEKLRAERA